MRVLVVDDHSVVRQGLRRLLESVDGVHIAEAATLAEADLQRDAFRPDIVVLDINLAGENGLEFVRKLACNTGAPRIVILTMHADAGFAKQAMALGAMGYVAKTSPPEELLKAINRVHRGERHLDTSLALAIVDEAAAAGDGFAKLSSRERDILKLIGDGRSMTEIAEILGVAYKTVANTALRLRDKIGAKGYSDLVRIAIERREQLR